MPGEQILLDPDDEGTGSELDITDPDLGYSLLSHEYPDPEPDVVMTGSIDTEGERPAAGKHKPRTITVTVRCVEPSGGSPSIVEIVSALQGKVGKLFREGGTLRRVLPSGEQITFDVLRFGARIQVPADKRWVVRRAADVTMTFTCAPYGRGERVEDVTLSEDTATEGAPLVFTVTGIPGDVPALGDMRIVGDPELLGTTWGIWGLRSRYYSADNELFYEAEDFGTGSTGPDGASGGTVIAQSNIDSDPGELGVDLLQSPRGDHTGSYRVFARVQCPSTNGGTVSVRLSWEHNATSALNFNDWVDIAEAGTPIEGEWVIVDMGEVNIPPAPLGGESWAAGAWAKSTDPTDDIYWDWFALVPISEGSAQVTAPTISSGVRITHNAVRVFDIFDNFHGVTSYEGDYLLIPPERTVQFIVMLGGQYGSERRVFTGEMGEITVTLSYTPRYITVPAPASP